MCTIIVARNIFENSPLVVAANRDELLDRPSKTPFIGLSLDGKAEILAPADLQRGGRWIGVNSWGVFVGLTNRIDIKSQKGRVSRGQVVSDCLQFKTALEAYENYAIKLGGSSLNGFNLIIADKKDTLLVQGDGVRISGRSLRDEDEGSIDFSELIIITNQGNGKLWAASNEEIISYPWGYPIVPQTSRRVSNVINTWKSEAHKPRKFILENLASLLHVHDDIRYGTCINEPENNYGTKSSSIIQLENNENWNYFHRERTGSNHICSDKFDNKIILNIQK